MISKWTWGFIISGILFSGAIVAALFGYNVTDVIKQKSDSVSTRCINGDRVACHKLLVALRQQALREVKGVVLGAGNNPGGKPGGQAPPPSLVDFCIDHPLAQACVGIPPLPILPRK